MDGHGRAAPAACFRLDAGRRVGRAFPVCPVAVPGGFPAARRAGKAGALVARAVVRKSAGHSVAVLLKIYAHCIDGQADAANKRIADALGGTGDSQDDQEP